MPYSMHLQTRTLELATELARAMNDAGDSLAPAALTIARIEYPQLQAARYLSQLDRMAGNAGTRLTGAGSLPDRVRALSEFVYDECGFAGNRAWYDDPRNSFLNEVLDRRTGIPISLSVVYLELARRVGLEVRGINFPGHFLLRATGSHAGDEDLIIDPFHGGAILSEFDCRQLLRQHVGEEAAYDPTLLRPATRLDVVVRMLINLKRLYVQMRSFPQAHCISTLLLTVDPAAVSELRDRGLLAYHLQDFAGALRDLEEYLRLSPRPAPDTHVHGADNEEGSADNDEPADEAAQIWDHVKALRRRVASFN